MESMVVGGLARPEKWGLFRADLMVIIAQVKGLIHVEEIVQKALVFAVLFVAGCFGGQPDTFENILPDLVATGGDDIAVPDIAGDTGYTPVFPVVYRFTEINIKEVGDQQETDLITQILSIQWKADIGQYKLNILFLIDAIDEAAGTIMLNVVSAVGTSDGALCVESTSKTESVVGDYDQGALAYFFDLVNIYSEDDDGTYFNCSMTGTKPNAIRLRSCEGTGVLSSDGGTVTGSLVCCMGKADVDSTCTCLGSCNPDVQNEDCAGCPNGATPLSEKLGATQTTPICTERLGEPAYDLRVSFAAERLELTPADCE